MTRLKLPIANIKTGTRLRADLGDIDALADSISRFGLIQPIVINQDNTLIAGERRLRAVISLNLPEIDVVYRETLSQDELRELELEENVRRKDMTWQERALAILEIHKLKSRSADLSGTKWGYRETGEMLGQAFSSVHYAVTVATALGQGDKELIACSSLKEALTKLLSRKEDQAVAALAKTIPSATVTLSSTVASLLNTNTAQPASTKSEIKINFADFLHNGDAIEWLKGMKPGQVDHIITDPPYGVDPDLMTQANTGMSNIDRIADTHQVDSNISLFHQLIPAAFNALPDHGFFIMWYDLDHHELLKSLGEKTGFRVQRWPLIWVKLHRCMNQMAQYNFTKSVEYAMVMRKQGSTLVSPQLTCHLAASNDTAKQLLQHPFVKPAEVWKWLMTAVALRGQTIADPFAGVGSSTVTAINEDFKPLACELDPRHYSRLVENVRATYAAKFGGSVSITK